HPASAVPVRNARRRVNFIARRQFSAVPASSIETISFYGRATGRARQDDGARLMWFLDRRFFVSAKPPGTVSQSDATHRPPSIRRDRASPSRCAAGGSLGYEHRLIPGGRFSGGAGSN